MDNDLLFKRIEELQKEINETNSTLDKKKVLIKYPELKEVLKYTYDDNIIYSVTSKNYNKFKLNNKKTKISIILPYKSFFKLLDDLSKRKITGDNALLYIYNYIKEHKSYENIILNIIDKNLKIRINKKLINSIFPNLIKEFNVALANKFDKKYIEKKDTEWYISRKLDGIRCLCHVNIKQNEIKFYSRQGKEFYTLNNLKKDIMNNINIFEENYYLDGEIVDMKNDTENFKGIMEKIRKKNYTIEKPVYYCFDIIKEEDFYNKKSNEIFTERYNLLKKILSNKFKYMKLLEQYNYNEEKMNEMIESSKEQKWEGLILRNNTIYEGKRSNNLLKFKDMEDDEFKVIDIEIGKIRYINPVTGLDEEIETLTAVIINYNNTKVGSGFTISERMKYYNNKEDILGKIITVKYFEKTKESLRFPVYKGIYGEKRDI